MFTMTVTSCPSSDRIWAQSIKKAPLAGRMREGYQDGIMKTFILGLEQKVSWYEYNSERVCNSEAVKLALTRQLFGKLRL